MESRKRGCREVSFGEKGERRSARSPPYPARSLPRACRRGQTEGEDGLALTALTLALSQDGRGDGRREGRIHRGGRRERRGRGGIGPHPRIQHGAGSRPHPGREPSPPEGEDGDWPSPPYRSTGQALGLSQDGRGDGSEEGREMLHHAAFCCISACYCQVVRRWSRGDSRIGLT